MDNQSFVKHLSRTGSLAKASEILDEMEMLQEDLIYVSAEGKKYIENAIDELCAELEELYKKYERAVKDPQTYDFALKDLKRQLMLAKNSGGTHSFVYL